jgi:hypothetical protein
MSFNKALRTAARRIEDGASLDELKEAARDLRTLAPDSTLADIVEGRIEIEERLVQLEKRLQHPSR